MLKFSVSEQKIVRTDAYDAVARTKNLKAQFVFESGDWKPPVFAVFQGMRTDPYTVCLDRDNSCTVPWEALRYGGSMAVSVYCVPSYPTNAVQVPIAETAYTGCFPMPSLNIYEQLLYGKADEIEVDHEKNDVLLKAFGKEISRAALPEGTGGGAPGKAATSKVGSVTASEPGSEPQITNSGTETDAVFDFVLPRGEQGTPGEKGEQGEKGEKGDAGEPGAQGEPGKGVPAGGAAGQVLAKKSETDYDTQWIDAPSGGGGSGDDPNAIKKDGSTVTTAPIPFAEGITVPNFKEISFSSETDYKSMIRGSTATAMIQASTPNEELYSVLEVNNNSAITLKVKGSSPHIKALTINDPFMATDDADVVTKKYADQNYKGGGGSDPNAIKKDGSTVTTAIIPFAKGIDVAHQQNITFRDTNGTTSVAQIHGNSSFLKISKQDNGRDDGVVISGDAATRVKLTAQTGAHIVAQV